MKVGNSDQDIYFAAVDWKLYYSLSPPPTQPDLLLRSPVGSADLKTLLLSCWSFDGIGQSLIFRNPRRQAAAAEGR